MLTVLGGGPAGLAVGYYARRSGLACTVLEAAGRAGGNCTTFEHEGFRFDSGAHRFHDKDAEITADIRQLLGEELRLVEVPSYIFEDGHLVDFPLSPLNLLQHLGPAVFAKAGAQVLASRLRAPATPRHFEDFAVATYGREIASRFLLNYSEKLWGLSCDCLSPDVAGKRLSGLGLATFLVEAVGGALARDRHLDGRFWYPRLGYGCIADALARECGEGAVRLRSRVTRIRHHAGTIREIEINGSESLAVEDVVSTLPLDVVLRVLDPAPPEQMTAAVRSMRYRNVVLVAFFIARASINDAGTVYFPSAEFPFTRVYEPRNRSSEMAPKGHTSLVVEIPCGPGSSIWSLEDDALIALARRPLESIGWLEDSTTIGATVRRLPYAYPVLEVGYDACVREVHDWLAGFTNLRITGRSGKFLYSWLHEMMRFGRDIVSESR